MKKFKTVFLLAVVVSLPFTTTSIAQVTVNPYGFGVFAEAGDNFANEITLHNGGEQEANFSISLRGGRSANEHRLAGPRRDNPGDVLQEVELPHNGALGISHDTENGTMWVSHTIQENGAVVNGFISEYEWNGEELGETLTDIHPGDNQWPLGGTFYDGIMYCTFWQNTFIMRYDREGNRLDNVALNAIYPMGFCVDPETEYLYAIIYSLVNIIVLDLNDNFNQVATIEGVLGHGNDGDFRSRLCWVPEHEDGHLWLSYEFRAYQLNITEDWEWERIQDFAVDSDVRSFGIGHDGENLWTGNNVSANIAIIDDGIVEPNWMTIEPMSGAIAAGENSVLTATIAPEGLDAGVYDLLVEVSFAEEAIEPFQLAVVLSYETPVANLGGMIVAPGSDDPIDGVEISLGEYRMSRWTGDDGRFAFDDLPYGEYQLNVSAPDYLSASETVELGENGLDLTIELFHAEFNLSNDEIQENLAPDTDTHVNFSATNDGNGPCTWSVERRLPGGADADPWEERGTIFTTTTFEDSRVEGNAFMEDHFFFAGANDADPNVIYIADREGNPTGMFIQPGESRYGMKDLDSDGHLLWGSGERRIFGFDTEGNIEYQFDGPQATNSAIAFDTDRNVVWTSTATSTIRAFSTGGQSFGAPLQSLGMRIYGLAYWPDDPDGHTLYILNSPDEGLIKVTKMDPESNDTMFVAQLDPPPGGNPVGASITNTFDVYSWVMMVSYNTSPDNGGDQTVIYQLDGRREWFTIAPEAGVLEPGQTQEFDVYLNATDLPAARFQGEFVFTHDGIGSAAIVSVELNVVEGPVVSRRTISLNPGWNLISTNIQPDPENIVELTQGLVDAGQLLMVKDDRGRFYLVSSHFSNLEPWLVSEGYWMKMTEAAELNVEGMSVLPDDPIQLAQGWQAVSYYPRVAVPATEALAGIVNVLVIVKDGAGNFYLPSRNFSNMGNMMEGKGYHLRVSEAVELVYQAGEGLASRTPSTSRSVYNKPGRYAPPAPSIFNMSILASADYSEGTDIGIYSGELLVGCGVFEGGLAGIAVMGDDPATSEIEGAVTGDLLSVRVRNDQGEIEANATPSVGNLVYQTDDFAGIDVEIANTPIEFGLKGVYPNPFNNRFTAKFDLPNTGLVSAGLFDLNGREVLKVLNQSLQAGNHQIGVSGESLASGVYIFRVQSAGKVSQMKIALVK